MAAMQCLAALFLLAAAACAAEMEDVGCAFDALCAGWKVGRASKAEPWALQDGRQKLKSGSYANRVTGISRGVSATNKKYLAAYLKAGGKASVSATVPGSGTTKDTKITFNYYQATDSQQFKVCCGAKCFGSGALCDGSDCTKVRQWKQADLACPAGTKKLTFTCKNTGTNIGSCGLDEVKIMMPKATTPAPVTTKKPAPTTTKKPYKEGYTFAFGSKRGMCYKAYYPAKKTQPDAAAACKADGDDARIANFADDYEWQHMLTVVKDSGIKDNYWMDGSDEKKHTVFYFTDGTDFAFAKTKFGKNLPDNYKKIERCLELNGNGSGMRHDLNDQYCGTRRPYLCMYKCEKAEPM